MITNRLQCVRLWQLILPKESRQAVRDRHISLAEFQLDRSSKPQPPIRLKIIEVLIFSGASAKLLRHLARRRPRSGARGGAAVYGPRRKDACARSSTRWRAGRLLRSRAKSRSGGL